MSRAVSRFVFGGTRRPKTADRRGVGPDTETTAAFHLSAPRSHGVAVYAKLPERHAEKLRAHGDAPRAVVDLSWQRKPGDKDRCGEPEEGHDLHEAALRPTGVMASTAPLSLAKRQAVVRRSIFGDGTGQ